MAWYDLMMSLLKVSTRLPGSVIGHYFQQISVRCLSNNYAVICRTHRPLYKRQYPTLFLCPDGSSYTCRYHEPRQVVKLPMDVSVLSEEERVKWLAKRKPVKRITYVDDFKSTYSSRQYVELVKKNKK